MPPMKKSPYDKLKKSELKALLLQRDKSTTAPQSSLAVRMTNSENAHTVSQDNGLGFLDFPGEIRNEIYKLVADYTIKKNDSRACTALYIGVNWDSERERRLGDCGNPQVMILQHGLFLTCRQIRTEGLPFFYQRRKFSLPLNHGKRILDLYWEQAGFARWFLAIGDLGQQNIRHLTLHNATMMKGIDSIERIHRKLSNEATVVYEAYTRLFAVALWKIRVRYQAKNEGKVPSFWRESDGSYFKVSNGDLLRGDWARYGLEFEARSGWFGLAQDDRSQLWWRRDKRTEKWYQEWLAKDEESMLDMYKERKSGQPRWRRVKAATVEEGSHSDGGASV